MDANLRTIREQITERIRDEVVAGVFSPGEALREADFAGRFGVSRGPVRDAFLRLAQEGLLAYQPNRGVTVSEPPKPENRALIVALRQQIECAVARRGVKGLDADDHVELESRLDDLRAACEREDSGAVASSDLAFHEALLLRCGGADFVPIWKWLCSRMLMTYGRLENFGDVHREHAEIFAAVRARQPAAVAAALKLNIQ